MWLLTKWDAIGDEEKHKFVFCRKEMSDMTRLSVSTKIR